MLEVVEAVLPDLPEGQFAVAGRALAADHPVRAAALRDRHRVQAVRDEATNSKSKT